MQVHTCTGAYEHVWYHIGPQTGELQIHFNQYTSIKPNPSLDLQVPHRVKYIMVYNQILLCWTQ